MTELEARVREALDADDPHDEGTRMVSADGYVRPQLKVRDCPICLPRRVVAAIRAAGIQAAFCFMPDHEGDHDEHVNGAALRALWGEP